MTGFADLHKTPLKLEEVLIYQNDKGSFAPRDTIIDETGSIVALRFKHGFDAENFAQTNQGKTVADKALHVLDNSALLVSVMDTIKTGSDISTLFSADPNAESFTKMLNWVLANIEDLCKQDEPEAESEKIKSLESLIETTVSLISQSVDKKEESSSNDATNDFALKYISKSNTLVVSQDNQLKLLYKENGRFLTGAGLFANKPQNPKDQITLTLSKSTFAHILSQFDLKKNLAKIATNNSVKAGLTEFLTAVKTAIEKDATAVDINVQVQYKHAKSFVNSLTGALFSSLRWVKSLVHEATGTLSNAKEDSTIQAPESDGEQTVTSSNNEAALVERIKKAKDASTLKDLNLNQIYLLLHHLLSIDEALYAMTLHSQCSNKLKRYWPSKKPRLFTAFGRLESLLVYPSNKFSLIQIAEAGLYNAQDILYDVRHFIDPERRVEELQNLRDEKDIWSLLQKSLSQNRMVQGLPSENVPLHVSVNNLPAQEHSKDLKQKIVNIASHENTSLISTVSQNGEVKVWNTEIALIHMGSTNFRKDLTTKRATILREGVGAAETVVAGLPVEETTVAVVIEDDTPANKEMLETLVMMGFPNDLAIKAMNLISNLNIDSVITKIEALREEEKLAPPKPQPQVQAQPQAQEPAQPKPPAKIRYDLTRRKPIWQCVACTFTNTDSSKYCFICNCQAPVTAYYEENEEEEEEQPEEDQEIEQSAPAAEQKETPTQKEVGSQSFLESARVYGNFIVPLESSPLSPVIVGVVFEEGTEKSQRYQLRLRRFAYASSYINKFLRKDKSKGLYSLISGTWFNKDSKAAQHHLTEDYGLTFRSLEPMFIGNPSSSNNKKTSEHLFSGEIVAFDEVNLNIDASPGQLVGLTVISNNLEDEKDTAQIYLVWNNNSKYTLQHLTIINHSDDPHSMTNNKLSYELKTVLTKTLDVIGNLLLVEANKDNLIIVTDKQLQVYSPLKLEEPRAVLDVPAKATHAKLIDGEAVFLLKEGGDSQILEFGQSTAAGTASTNEAKASSPSASSNQIPDIDTLTDENIESIYKSLHQEPLEGLVFQNNGVIQSSIQSHTNKATRFFLPIGWDKHQRSQDSNLEISLAQPTSLTNLEISIYFDFLRENKLQTQEQERTFISSLSKDKQESTGSSGQEKPLPQAEKSSESQLSVLNMAEGDSSSKLLALTITSFKGASLNEKHSVARILSPNNDVFCANYPDSEFIFENLHGKSMLVKSVVIQSKLKATEKFSAPIGSGLIFTADYLSHLSQTTPFHKMKHEDFLEWTKNRSEVSEIQPWEPVGSFQFDDRSESITVDLIFTRPSKYIMLRPTSSRSDAEATEKFSYNTPVEIKFFGASGALINQESSGVRRNVSSERAISARGTELVIKGRTQEGKWIPIQTLKDVPVQTIVDSSTNHLLHENWNTVTALPLWGSSTQIIANEILFQGRFNKISVEAVKTGEQVSLNWIIAGFSIQGYFSNSVDKKPTTGPSPAMLRNLLLDSKEFDKFNAKFIQELTKPEIPRKKRLQIVKLIAEILSLEPKLVSLYYKNFDVKSFLQNAILVERDGTFIEIQSFLQCFSTQKEFAQDLLEAVIAILPTLSKSESITQAGLNGFFSLLTWCQSLNPGKIFNTLLQELLKLIGNIEEVRNPAYNLLRTQYNISGLVLEKNLFSEANITNKQTVRKTKEDTSEKQKEKTPLKLSYLAYYGGDIDEYLIDLAQKSRIDEIRLAFDHSNRSLKFRVQIWAVTEDNINSKKLIHSKFYNEATWIQLTNYAYDRFNVDNYYKPTDELESLGFSNLNVNSRYLVVQVTYTLLPFILPPTDKNDKKIIPEVYGEILSNQSGEITSLQTLFSTKNTVQKEQVSYAHSAKYDKFDIPGKDTPFKHLFVSSDSKAKPSSAEGEVSVVVSNEESLNNQLEEMQTELLGKLETYKDSSHGSSQEEVVKLCEDIEDVQLKILGLQADRTSSVKLRSSLDYLYLLTSKISNALYKLDASTSADKSTWRTDEVFKGDQGKKISLDIFSKVIAFENGTISKDLIKLLTSVFINNLKKNEWHAFILFIINNFLTDPVDIRSDPSNKIYSHARIIKAMNQISVPISELLSYLTTKLNISTEENKSTIAQSREKESPALICTLISVLLLLKKQYSDVCSANNTTVPSTSKKSSKKNKDNDPAKKSDNKSREDANHTQEKDVLTVYSICTWISEELSSDDGVTSNILSLAIDVLAKALSLSKVSNIHHMLKDSQSFLRLFMFVVKIGSSELLTKFASILNKILELKPQKDLQAQEQTVEENLIEETNILLAQHLQTALKWLVNYSISSEQIPSYSGLTQKDLSVETWTNHVCFILDFLLNAAEKKAAEKKATETQQSQEQTEEKLGKKSASKTENLEAPGMNRSLSASQEPIVEAKQDAVEKLDIVPIDTLSQIVLLLSPSAAGKPEFNLGSSSVAWSLVMRVISGIKLAALIDSKVFNNLIKSFLSAGRNIQDTVFSQIVALTKTIVNNQTHQKEFGNVLLSTTFTSLNFFANEAHNHIGFSLVKSWLDILMTGESPKPESTQNKPIVKAFCKLNTQGALTLFTNLSAYLINFANFGSKEGVQFCSDLYLVRLQLANELSRLLVIAENGANTSSVGDLFSNYKRYTKEIQEGMKNFIQWYLINRTTETSQSPATDTLKSLSENVFKLLEIVEEYQEVTKTSIAALVQGCKDIDETLTKLQVSQQISALLVLQYNQRSSKILEELFNLWVVNDTIASFAVLEVKGFEYLLEKMSFIGNTSTSSTTQKQLSSPYLKGTDLLNYISKPKESTKQEQQARVRPDSSTTSTTEDPKEEEFANKLTVINQPGQTWNIPPDWSTHKKGGEARILLLNMTGAFYNEYTLVLKMDKTVEVNQIRIGFHTVLTEFTDKVIGIPSSIVVEGGTSESNLTHIGSLQPINDGGYTEYAIKVYGINFQRIQEGAGRSINTSLESLSQKKVSHLRFRFARPVVNLVEELSLLSGKLYKNVALSVSFVSIMGIDTKKNADILKKTTETQEKYALQIISKICSQQFAKTLEVIANDQTIISKIKSSFDALTALLIPHEAWLTPIFLAIASHNNQMGDWIISRFLDLNRSREHARIVGEIVLIQEEFIFSRVIQLHKFILFEIKRIILLSKAESMNKFNRLVPFIEAFCLAIRSLPVDFVQSKANITQQLSLKQEDVDIIIQSFEHYNASTNSKVLIKLLLLYLYIPAPFVIEDQSLLKFSLEKLWNFVSNDKKTLYYEFLGPLIIGSSFSAKWFLLHLDEVFTDTLSKLENFSSSNVKTLKYSFTLLNNVSRNDLIKKKMFSNKWHLKLYEGLLNKDSKAKHILKETETDIIQLVVDFLKNTILGYPQAEEELAQVLIKDIDLLDSKRDFSFVNNLLIPLLNAETEVPVCLYPVNTETGRIITDLKRLPTQTANVAPQTTEPLKSKLLNENQAQVLLSTIQDRKATGSSSKKPKSQTWELALTTTTDCQDILSSVRQNLSNKGPFLIVLEGLNQGKKCHVGVYSSQPVPDLPDAANTQVDCTYTIPPAEDSFIFYYNDQTTLHFAVPLETEEKEFGALHTFYDGGGGLSFSYEGLEIIFISFSPYQLTSADISLAEMTPLATDNRQGLPDDLLKDFVVQSTEYWILKSEEKLVTAQKTPENTKITDSILNSTFLTTCHHSTQPLNYYRASPVYNIPSTLTIEKLTELALNSDVSLMMRSTRENLDRKALLADLHEFIVSRPEVNGIVDLEFDAHQYLEKKITKKTISTSTSGEPEELKYKPALTFFESFEKNEGVKKIIEVGLRALENWKDKSESKKWRTWLQELSTFGALPNFFGLFLKNKDCIDLLFKILTGKLDKIKLAEDSSPDKKVDEEEHKAVKYSYQILAEVFGCDSDAKLRDFAIEKQFFQRILDRIGLISKESTRKWYDDYKKKEKEEEEKSSPEKRAEEGEEGYKKKIVKKKGVGYASDNTGQNQKWNVSEYVESKKSRNEQLQSTIEILTNFLDSKDWQPSKKLVHEICESSLLPLLESALRSASLLEMAKEASLNQSYLSNHYS